MSTEETRINGQETDGVIAVTSGLYPFDAKEINVVIQLKKGATMTHVMRKPTLKDHLAREEALKRVSKAVGKTEFVSERNEEEVNVDFYDSLIIKAIGRRPNPEHEDNAKAPKELEHEVSADDARAWTMETKHKVIEEMYTFDFSVEESDDPFAVLSEREEPIRVVQKIGDVFKVVYLITPPTVKQRRAFGRTVEIKEKYENRKKSLRTSLKIEKGVNLFNTLFAGVEGGMVGGAAFSDELRPQFLKEIDPMWQYAVMDRAVGSFDVSRD